MYCVYIHFIKSILHCSYRFFLHSPFFLHFWSRTGDVVVEIKTFGDICTKRVNCIFSLCYYRDYMIQIILILLIRIIYNVRAKKKNERQKVSMRWWWWWCDAIYARWIIPVHIYLPTDLRGWWRHREKKLIKLKSVE